MHLPPPAGEVLQEHPIKNKTKTKVRKNIFKIHQNFTLKLTKKIIKKNEDRLEFHLTLPVVSSSVAACHLWPADNATALLKSPPSINFPLGKSCHIQREHQSIVK